MRIGVKIRCDCKRCGLIRHLIPSRVCDYCQLCAIKVYYDTKRKSPEEVATRKRNYQKEYYKKNRGRCDRQARDYNRNLKREVVNGYGGKCKWCGIDDIDVLTIDHVNDNGSLMRKSRGHKESGHSLMRDLRNRNFPDEYQILCANCNMKKEIARRRNAKQIKKTS